MKNFLLKWALPAALVYFVVTQPDKAANALRWLGGVGLTILNGFIRLITNLAG